MHWLQLDMLLGCLNKLSLRSEWSRNVWRERHLLMGLMVRRGGDMSRIRRSDGGVRGCDGGVRGEGMRGRRRERRGQRGRGRRRRQQDSIRHHSYYSCICGINVTRRQPHRLLQSVFHSLRDHLLRLPRLGEHCCRLTLRRHSGGRGSPHRRMRSLVVGCSFRWVLVTTKSGTTPVVSRSGRFDFRFCRI